MTDLFAIIMTTLTFAVIPWAIAQATITWQPKLQASKRHRGNYRRITAAFALALTIPSMFQAVGPWTYLLAIGAATAVDVHWWRYARTTNGKTHLADARAARQLEREVNA